MQEHVKREIAPYKYPRAIEFVAQLPKTETGKLKRFTLRQMAQAAAGLVRHSRGIDRHCERSEAIHGSDTQGMDCFVAEPVIGRAFARPVGSSQ
jgi:hypothetical protein